MMLILMVAFEGVAPSFLLDRIPELLTLFPILAVGSTKSRIVKFRANGSKCIDRKIHSDVINVGLSGQQNDRLRAQFSRRKVKTC